MTETLLILYTALAAAGTFVLLSLLGAAGLRARRRRSRDAVLRTKYLRIVMLYLLAGEGPAPRFPMIRRVGARLLLAETIAGLADVTYGLDAAPLRRIVAEYGLDDWLLRRTARSRAYRRRAACCCSRACPPALRRGSAPRVMPRAATVTCVSSR